MAPFTQTTDNDRACFTPGCVAFPFNLKQTQQLNIRWTGKKAMIMKHWLVRVPAAAQGYYTGLSSDETQAPPAPVLLTQRMIGSLLPEVIAGSQP